MTRKRYHRVACIVGLIVGLIVGPIAVLFYFTRYTSKERGVRLSAYRTEQFTYDVWSHGHWMSSKTGTSTVSIHEGPYTVLLAISPKEPEALTITILNAWVIDDSGDATSVFNTLVDQTDTVKRRPNAAISGPYAVFRFDRMLSSHETRTLKIEFEISGLAGVESTTQTLTLHGYETVRRSFTFWETMMSV